MRTSRVFVAAALAFAAAAGMQGVQYSPQAKALLTISPMRETRRRHAKGGGLGGSHQWGYRGKPWTCTAIEQRKAAKRRNVKRVRARRRA